LWSVANACPPRPPPAEKFSDLFSEYFNVIAYSCVGVAAMFGLTFLACCYLCCCAKVDDDEANAQLTYGAPPRGKPPQGAYIARP